MTITSESQVLPVARTRRPNPGGGPKLTRHRGGSGQPLVLVLVHGLGLSWRSWQPVLDALEGRHDVVAIDLPGFGESPRLPDRAAPTPARLADAVESELDRLSLDAPALVGNSLGGWVGARAGATRPSGARGRHLAIGTRVASRTRLSHRPQPADASPRTLWRAAGEMADRRARRFIGTAICRVSARGSGMATGCMGGGRLRTDIGSTPTNC